MLLVRKGRVAPVLGIRSRTRAKISSVGSLESSSRSSGRSRGVELGAEPAVQAQLEVTGIALRVSSKSGSSP